MGDLVLAVLTLTFDHLVTSRVIFHRLECMGCQPNAIALWAF